MPGVTAAVTPGRWLHHHGMRGPDLRWLPRWAFAMLAIACGPTPVSGTGHGLGMRGALGAGRERPHVPGLELPSGRPGHTPLSTGRRECCTRPSRTMVRGDGVGHRSQSRLIGGNAPLEQIRTWVTRWGETGPLLGAAARGDGWRGPTSRSRLLNLFRRCSTGCSYAVFAARDKARGGRGLQITGQDIARLLPRRTLAPSGGTRRRQPAGCPRTCR